MDFVANVTNPLGGNPPPTLFTMRFVDLTGNVALQDGMLFVRCAMHDSMAFVIGNQLLKIQHATMALSVEGSDDSGFCLLRAHGWFTKHTDAFFSGQISSRALERLEKLRAGGDLVLHATCKMTVDRVKLVANNNLTQDFTGVLMADFSGVRIPASDWSRRILPAMGYSAPRWVELPDPASSSIEAEWPAVWSHLESARRALFDGATYYRTTGEYCWKALDALAKGLNYKGWPDLCTVVGERSEREERMKALRAFANYLQLWRHDDTQKGESWEHFPEVTFQEAQFVYVTTVHLVSFVLADHAQVRT